MSNFTNILAVSYTTYYAAPIEEALELSVAMILGILFFSVVVGCLGFMALTWGMFKKAGYKGWEGVVPGYNLWCLVKIAGLEPLWFVLCLFISPLLIYVYIKVAEKFGKSAAYGVGLAFIPIVFLPMLSYGSAVYYGPNAQPMNGQPMNGQPMNGQQPYYGQPMGQPMYGNMNNGQPMGQPMNQPMYGNMNNGQPMGQPMNQPMYGNMNNGQPMNQPMNQQANQPMNQPMDQPMAQQADQPDNPSSDNNTNA